MKNPSVSLSASLACLVAVSGFVSACSDRGGQTAPAAAAAASAAASVVPDDPRVVKAPAALAARLRVAAVATEPVAEPLKLVGRVDFNEQAVARIGASVTGRITEILATPGQTVKAGDVLAQLHSTELGTAQLAFLKANAQQQLAAKAVERARLLLAADVIGSAELQRRENELGVAEAERRAAADQLRVMGVPSSAVAQTARTGAITSVSAVVSTVAGVVVDRRINKGQVVQPADVLYTVADLSKVWVVAQVPEAQIARVQVGQEVRIEVGAQGVEPQHGRLSWVAETVNPETRTVTVRTELDNPRRQLKPAMLANVIVQPLPVERLVVPSSAVVREDNVDHVFVRVVDGQDAYRLTPVKLGEEISGVRVVEDGLKGGEKIVIDGAFHLNNERKRSEMEGS